MGLDRARGHPRAIPPRLRHRPTTIVDAYGSLESSGLIAFVVVAAKRRFPRPAHVGLRQPRAGPAAVAAQGALSHGTVPAPPGWNAICQAVRACRCRSSLEPPS